MCKYFSLINTFENRHFLINMQYYDIYVAEIIVESNIKDQKS